jgi:hypothetical protein
LIVRRLLLVTCLLAGLLSASAGSAQAMPLAKACKPAKKKVARTSAVARPTPIRVREAKRRAAARRRAVRRRCVRVKARRRVVAPQTPAAGTPGAPAPQPGPAAPQAPGAPAPDDPPPPTVPEPPANPFAVQVLSGEFFLHLSKTEVHAGNVRVEFNNSSAEDPHDLHLFREDGTGSSYSFGELQSGEVEAKTLKLNAGTWRLICALPEHAERGMSANLRVVNG